MTDQWLRRSARPDAPTDAAGAVITEYRLASGQNQVAVASAMGMTQQHLSQIEHGKRPVSPEQRRKFADVLNIPPENLGLAGTSTLQCRTTARSSCVEVIAVDLSIR